MKCMNNSKENIICDIENYKKNYDYTAYFRYSQYYKKLICHYLEYLCDHTSIKHKKYFLFILKRGILSLSHVFNMLLLYTKNIELTIAQCNKALYYYIEFIGQIADDTHSYLQLNSKDATLFVYKKTIFEINNDYRKNYTINDKDSKFFDGITVLNNICNEIINLIIGEKQFEIKKKEVFINYIINKINKIMSKLSTFTNTQLENKAPIILFFIHSIPNSVVDLDKLLAIYEYFIKKIRKHNITITNIKDYIYHNDHVYYLTTLSANKYINRLFAQ